MAHQTSQSSAAIGIFSPTIRKTNVQDTVAKATPVAQGRGQKGAPASVARGHAERRGAIA
jgi:hypothetical protein